MSIDCMFLSGSTQKSEVASADTRKRSANIQNRINKNTNTGHRIAYLRDEGSGKI